MKLLRLSFFAAILLACVGCGSKEQPFTDNSKDSVAFAQSIKELVLNSTERLKSSNQPADGIRGIVLALSELKDCPTGEHLPTYEKLLSLSSELLKESENGKSAGFDGKLKAIEELATSLPGDAKVEKEKKSE